MRFDVAAASRLACGLLALVLSMPRLAGAQETGSPLPPVDTTASISEAQRRLDEAVAVRVREIETTLADLQRDLPGATTANRIRILEEKAQLAEARTQIERARALGVARSKYTAGYKLLGDMQLKSRGLVAAGLSVSAYNSIAELTDLRKYEGFQAAFDGLTSKVGDQLERSWLTGLIESTIPKLGATASNLTGLSPIVGAAGFALSQLRTILPVFAKEKLKGREFITTYGSLMCGLNSVAELHADLSSLATLNARWTEQLDSLVHNYTPALTRYRTLVGAPGNGTTDAQFYATVQERFDQQTQAGTEDFLQFSDDVNAQNAAFEAAARAYYVAASRHLEYWEQLRQLVLSRRDLPCMSADPLARSRFNAAVTNIDRAIAEIRNAYMFAGTDRPENEYFRVVIGHD